MAGVRRRCRPLLATLLLAAACSEPQPEVLLDGDGTRSGEQGELGPLGAARLSLAFNVRVTETMEADITYPLWESGEAVEGPLPVIAFTPGGLVSRERYQWMATHFASRGYVTVLASQPLDLAIIASDNTRLALDEVFVRSEDSSSALFGLTSDEAPRLYMGHSLGGVIAADLWVADADSRSAVILASFPAGYTDVAARAGDPVMSLSGTADGSATESDVEEGFSPFESPAMLAFVEGLHHYGWTDDNSESELARDGEPGREVDEMRRDAMFVLDSWLDAVLEDDGAAKDRIADFDYPNVDERVRTELP